MLGSKEFAEKNEITGDVSKPYRYARKGKGARIAIIDDPRFKTL